MKLAMTLLLLFFLTGNPDSIPSKLMTPMITLTGDPTPPPGPPPTKTNNQTQDCKKQCSLKI